MAKSKQRRPTPKATAPATDEGETEPKSKRGRPPKPRPFQGAYEALGGGPEDALEMVGWAGEALRVSMKEVLFDKDMEPRLKRQEIRAIAKCIQNGVPAERLLQAERTVRDAAAVMERTEGGAKMVDSTGEAAPRLRLDS